jgi:hypothetical protein
MRVKPCARVGREEREREREGEREREEAEEEKDSIRYLVNVGSP